jgi:hypothetical protein
MKFKETFKGYWESEKQTITAVMLDSNGELRHDAGEARYIIEEGEYKGNTVYRLYERGLNRKSFVKRFKTLEQAITEATKMEER